MKNTTKLWLSLIAAIGINASAQVRYEGLDKTYTEVMDSLFTQIDKSKINTGILYDRVFSLYDLTEKKNGDTESSNFWDFSQRLHEVRLASYQPIYKDVKVLHQELKSNEKVYIGVLNTSVNYIDYGTGTNPNLTLDKGYFSIVPGKEPIQEEAITLIAPLKEYVYAEQVTFALDSKYIFQHTQNPIKNIEADLGDGTKYLLISNYQLIDSEITVKYQTEGKKKASFKIDFTDGSQSWRFSDFTVLFPIHIDDFGPFQYALEENFTNQKGITPNNADNVAFKGYNETSTSAGQLEYRTYYNKVTNNGSAPSKIMKPIIILDGFDPGDKRKIYRGSQGYNEESKSIYELMSYDDDGNPNNIDVNLVEQLRSTPYGFDVTLVNFQEGADYIERNAMALVALIKRENAKLAANGSNEELIIVGPSMGGLISRYALSYMEKNNIPHNTKLWVSFDSPHLGANIPIGAQENLYFFGYNGKQLMAEMKFDENFRSPAARQMLIEQLDGLHEEAPYENLWNNSVHGQNNQTPFRNTFNNNLSSNGNFGTIGFPQNLRKIALVNGTTNGKKTNSEGQKFLEMAAFTKFLSIDIKAASINDCFMGNFGEHKTTFEGNLMSSYFGYVYFAIRNVKGKSSRTNINSRGVMDIVPGGTFNTAEIIKNEFHQQLESTSAIKKIEWRSSLTHHSFIPTVSALAFKNSNFNWSDPLDRNLVCDPNNKEIHFDSYFAPSTNEEHIHLTKENVDWLLKEFMGEPQVPHFPLSANLLEGPGNLCVNETGVYSFNDVCKIPGEVVQWITPTNLSVISSSEHSITVKAISTGQPFASYFITAIFSNGQKYIKSINIGKPSTPSFITGNETIFVYQGQTIFDTREYSITPVPHATYYEWQLPGNYVIVDQFSPNYIFNNNWELLASKANTNSIEVKPNWSTDGYIRVRACNDCGCSDYKSLYIRHEGQNSGGYYELTPNPGSVGVTINLANENQYPIFRNGQTEVQVFNAQAILVKNFQITEKGGYFDVSNLPIGIYKVQIDLQNGNYQVINLKVSR